MSIGSIDAVDPNATTVAQGEIAKVYYAVARAKNSMEPGTTGALIQEIEKDLLNLEDQLARAVVSSDESEAAAGLLIKHAKTSLARLDAERKKLGDPFRNVVESVNGFFKPFQSRLADVDAEFRRKIGAYILQKRIKAEEAAAAERKRIEDEALALAQQQSDAGDQVGANVILEESQKAIDKTEAVVAPVQMGGVNTGSAKRKVAQINSLPGLLRELSTWSLTELDGIIEIKPQTLLRRLQAKGLTSAGSSGATADGKTEIPAVEIIEVDSVRIY